MLELGKHCSDLFESEFLNLFLVRKKKSHQDNVNFFASTLVSPFNSHSNIGSIRKKKPIMLDHAMLA